VVCAGGHGKAAALGTTWPPTAPPARTGRSVRGAQSIGTLLLKRQSRQGGNCSTRPQLICESRYVTSRPEPIAGTGCNGLPDGANAAVGIEPGQLAWRAVVTIWPAAPAFEFDQSIPDLSPVALSLWLENWVEIVVVSNLW
jgi:hypothetical protein